VNLKIPFPGSAEGVRGFSGKGRKDLPDYFPIIIMPFQHLVYMVIVTIMGKT
jgi:hypothetical protein